MTGLEKPHPVAVIVVAAAVAAAAAAAAAADAIVDHDRQTTVRRDVCRRESRKEKVNR